MQVRKIAVKENIRFMRLAIAEAKKNLLSMDGGPFGACIVRGNKVLALARNTVLKNDATCHAEINAIRMASKKIKDFDLAGCVIYSTCEPCPMCFSAIHWAGISTLIYATQIIDAKKIGFKELPISTDSLKKLGRSKVSILRSRMIPECRELFRAWNAHPKKKIY